MKNFQKRFFWLKCSHQFLENSFHTFARKEFGNSEKVSTKIQKKNFFRRNCCTSNCSSKRLEGPSANVAEYFLTKVRKKIAQIRKKKTTFKILLFSSKWSSEHVGIRFDSFVENSEPHVRKVLLKVRLHNEKKKKLKKSVSSTYFWRRRKQIWQSLRGFFAESQKMFRSDSEKLWRELFKKDFFGWSVRISF